MNTVGRTSLHLAAVVTGTLILLVVTPHLAFAQAVNGFLRPGGRAAASSPAPAQSAPAQSAPQYPPMRSGAIFARPLGSFGASPFATTPGNTGGPVFRNTRPSGPVTVIPDAADTPDFRDRRPRSYIPVGPANGYPANGFYGNSLPPVGPSSGFSNNSMPPVGPGNGFFSNATPPVGPGNGFFNSRDNRPTRPVGSGYEDYSGRYSHGRDERNTTAGGTEEAVRRVYRNNYIYNTYTVNPIPIIAGAPPLLGGFYYSSYCDTFGSADTYPSVYCAYDGFPRYIFNPTVVVIGQPYYPVYATSYQPFYTPIYPVTYNQNNYYVTNEDRAQDLEAGGERAQTALRHAYPANSYQAAFGDIARAWMDSSITPLRKHIRDSDTRISVFLNTKYSYSIASGDFVQITRDALDRLNTVSFDFTRLRKAKNGDVTAYGTHVYRVEETPAGDGKDGSTVPFDQNGTDQVNSNQQTTSPYDRADDPAGGTEKTMYVSYTLRHRDSQWYIVAVNSSDHDLVPDK